VSFLQSQAQVSEYRDLWHRRIPSLRTGQDFSDSQ